MGHLLSDVRGALRQLWKTPLFATTAILSLGLGIGANTAIFTLVDQILLRLLPVENPEELVLLSPRGFHHGSNMGEHSFSYPTYQDLNGDSDVFEALLCRAGFDGVELGISPKLRIPMMMAKEMTPA